MELLELLQSNVTALLIAAGIIGLYIGSFLNVVIYRLPVMLQKDWQQQCKEYLNPDEHHPQDDKPFNLARPASRCPHCKHPVHPLANIPVLSWLVLRGKCAECKKPISIRYPIIETLSCLLSVAVAWHFGYGWACAGALVLTWALIALTMIDYDHQLLPDIITLPFLWLGLFLSVFNIYVDSHTSIIGALVGYLSLWSVYKAFKFFTGKEGMGYGDFKLLALLGAWMGWQMIPAIVLMSSLVGAVVGITLVVSSGRDKSKPIPFGPYLAAAGWICLLWGDQLISTYLAISAP